MWIQTHNFGKALVQGGSEPQEPDGYIVTFEYDDDRVGWLLPILYFSIDDGETWTDIFPSTEIKTIKFKIDPSNGWESFENCFIEDITEGYIDDIWWDGGSVSTEVITDNFTITRNTQLLFHSDFSG